VVSGEAELLGDTDACWWQAPLVFSKQQQTVVSSETQLLGDTDARWWLCKPHWHLVCSSTQAAQNLVQPFAVLMMP
jgi:hypothetical protein